MNDRCMRFLVWATVAAFLLAPAAAQEDRFWIAINPAAGERAVASGATLSWHSADAGPATRLHLPAEFLPNQFRGPYVAGVLGAGEGDSGFFVAVDRQGIIYGAYFDRCWEDRWVFLDFTGHPQLALDGSSVVETRLDPQRDVKVLKGAACPP